MRMALGVARTQDHGYNERDDGGDVALLRISFTAGYRPHARMALHLPLTKKGTLAPRQAPSPQFIPKQNSLERQYPLEKSNAASTAHMTRNGRTKGGHVTMPWGPRPESKHPCLGTRYPVQRPPRGGLARSPLPAHHQW